MTRHLRKWTRKVNGDGWTAGNSRRETKGDESGWHTSRNDSHTFHAAGSWRHRSFSNFCARHWGWHAGSRWFQEGQTGTVVGTEKIGEKERPPVGTPHTNTQPLRTYDRVSNCTWLRLPRCLLSMTVSWSENREPVRYFIRNKIKKVTMKIEHKLWNTQSIMRRPC